MVKLPDATLIRKLDAETFIIKIKNRYTYDSLKNFLKVFPANNQWKLSPEAQRRENIPDGKTLPVILSTDNLEALQYSLKIKFPGLRIYDTNISSKSLLIHCSANRIAELVKLSEVIFLDIQLPPREETEIPGYVRSFHGLNLLDYNLPGVNGRNITAGVKEQMIDSGDLDLYKRVLPSPLASTNVTNHATIIASIIGGAGNSSCDGKGVAWGCRFFPSSFSNLFPDDDAVLKQFDVSVQNHSYGTAIQQYYGAEAAAYDIQAWEHPQLALVFSSGNQGESQADDGSYAYLDGYSNLTGNFKMAKNIITVGAINNDGTVAPESSSGPLYDGRLAPQLTALGPGGTSDAAAFVSGTIAVMQQSFKDSNQNNLPPASLIKSVLYNTAEDIGNVGIDFKTGFGLLNSYEAVLALQQKKYDGSQVSQDRVWEKIISIPLNAASVKVTLSWTDTATGVNNFKALENDLDLEVKEISSGLVYYPWVLNLYPNVDSLSQLPHRRRDSLNTSEQVTITLPPEGKYKISVRGSQIISKPIPFHISYSIDTLNTFTFLNPLRASDVDKEKINLPIKWKCSVADSSAEGSLFITYNNGNTWESIDGSVKLQAKEYKWMMKDTNAVARLKMKTSFGEFISNQFLISDVIRPRLDFSCADSFRLSWNKHVYAKSYDLYVLNDSPYLKKLQTITDTFIVMKRTSTILIYAVLPVLENRLPTARSRAINLEQAGVNCFYRNFFYDLLDGNDLKMVLELSTALYADSIFFEQVTNSGEKIKIYGSTAVTNNQLVYSTIGKEIASGQSYVRAGILLKNGIILYTDILPVLTSGKKYILFFPNPFQRHGILKYIIQQGVKPGSHILFYDAVGRLVTDYTSFTGNIDISRFPKGTVIYKLMTSENAVLQTGKLIIQ